MKPGSIRCNCPLCGVSFAFGPHLYKGHWLPKYGMTICSSCYKYNWDGFAPQYDTTLLKSLNANGLPIPQRNANGLLPRD